ncbi:MAG: hypothetical protein Q8P45_00860 [Candidatus Harrisonbacteria bacterium]|nr:hypothetical protein [Candidatus Harrisonbacteria bacterium]
MNEREVIKMQMAAKEIGADEAFGLLKGWFNNKIAVVVFRIQYAHVYIKKGQHIDVREQLIFLHDIQHHFSRRGIDQSAYYDATKWLKAFFRVYPSKATPERAKKAWRMLKIVYEGFGLKFPFGDDGNRKEVKPLKSE